MRLFAIGLILFGTTLAQAQDKKFSPLYEYLLQEAQTHFDARRKIIAGLKTPEQIQKRQQDLKAQFIASLGGFPEKTPLNAKVVGTVPGNGFRVEKVIYESRPNHHVTANLYIPNGPGPFPGVLVPCGHSANGKAAEAYQRICILLAQNGLAAMCYDPIGQGERLQLLDSNGQTLIKGSTSEHTMVGIGGLLVGRQTASYRVWDGIRSLDYLASRPEIRADKLGCTGNSGGGTLTSYLMALDDRIAVAAPSCYICSLEKLFKTLGPQDGEQNITGQVAFGMEHADFLTMRAPKPTLIAVATHDFFDIDGAWNVFREASVIYGRLGYGEKVALFEYEDKHGFSKPRREASMRWLRRWLLDKNDSPQEGTFTVFSDKQLQCSRTGQVVEDLKGKSVYHLNVEEARRLEAKRPAVSAEQLSALVQKVLHLSPLPKEQDIFSSRLQQSSPSSPISNPISFTTEKGVHVPGTFFQEAGKGTKTLLYLTSQASTSAENVAPWMKEGYNVLALNVRGLSLAASNSASFGNDSREAFLALHLNRPLLGQRVYDVLAVIRQWPQATKIHLVAEGQLGPVALHVALLEPRITQVTLERSLGSWMQVVEAPVSVNQLSNAVPGVLAHYDLPELAGALSPRPLTIRQPTDARGGLLSQEEAVKIFHKTKQGYAMAADQLKIVP